MSVSYVLAYLKNAESTELSGQQSEPSKLNPATWSWAGPICPVS